MANVRTQIDIDINTSAAAAGLRSLQSQINAFNTALQRSNKGQMAMSKGFSAQLIESVNASKYFAAEMVRMQSAAGALDTTLSKGQVTMKQFFSQKFIKDGLEASRVLSLANARAAALQTQFVATSAAANGFRDAIAIRPLEAFNKASAVTAQRLIIQRAMLQQATTSMINFGKNTQWAGRQLMVGFTVPLTIFGAVAGKTFMDLEKQAVNFKKVYGDAFTPPAELEANLKAVMELGKEYTKYGIALKDTVGLAAEAAAAGAQNKDLIDATTQATRLATLGQMEQNEALETTIALQNAFKLTGEDLAKSINFLNMVENQTVVTLQDLSAAIPRVAPVIKGLGGDVEDLAAFMAAMQEGGVSAEQGANALKSGLASLINPTTRAKERLDQFGISLDSIIMANKGDLMGTVQAFADALDTLDQFSRQQALEEVFGKFQYARLGALFDNINKDGTQAARTLELAGMSAAEMAASAEKELSAIENAVGTKFVAAMERLKAEIAPIGELFIKMATPIVNFLSTIAEKFNNLPDFSKKFILFGTVITGIVIPAGTMFLGLLMNLIGTLTKFGHLTTIFVKGLAQGGIRQALQNVTQATQYMTLAEIDATNAARQLSGATLSVNAALTDQVGDAAAATAAISKLAGSYANLAASMRGAAALAPSTLGLGAGAMRGRSIVGKPLPIVKRNRGGSIPYFGAGDTVPGSGNKDTVPAMLTPGEFIVNKEATAQNFDLLTAINDGNNVEYRNKGGGIATTGRRYYGRFPSSLAAARAEAAAAAQAQRDELAIIQALTGSRGLRSTSQSTSLASRSNLFETMVSRDTKPGQMIKILNGLGMRPDEFGLRSVGNYVLALSNRANDAMKRGVLSKQALLSELNANPGVAYGPIASQVTRYFGRGFDSRLFDTLYRQELGRVKDPISDATFRKLSRNALRRYLDSSGFDRNQRKSFLRDIVAGDTVRGGASVTRIKQVLAQNGVPFTQSGDDVYATIRGRQYNFGQLTAKSLDDLGRPSGISSYRDLQVPAGMVRAHANKGGGIATPGRMFYGNRWNPTAITMYGKTAYFRGTTMGPNVVRAIQALPTSKERRDAWTKVVNHGKTLTREKGSKNQRQYLHTMQSTQDIPILNEMLGINISKSPFHFAHATSRRSFGGKNFYSRYGVMTDSGTNLKMETGTATWGDYLKNTYSRGKNSIVGQDRLLKIAGIKTDQHKEISKEINNAIIDALRKKPKQETFGQDEFNTFIQSVVDPILLKHGVTPTTIKNIKQRNMTREGNPVNRNLGGIIPGFNKGNIVPGVGDKDTVPAMLTPGEFVVNKQATRENLDLLRSINSGQLRGYAEGDIVERIKGNYFAEGYNKKEFGPFATKEEARQIVKNMGIGKQVITKTSGNTMAFERGTGRGMGRSMGVGMGMGAIGGAMMMAPMIPSIGQNEGLSTTLGAGGMALSVASMLPMLGPVVGGIVAAAGGLAASLYLLKSHLDKSAKEAAKFGASLGGAANRMEKISAATGYQFAAQRSPLEKFRFTRQEAENASEFSDYFASEAGQAFIDELTKQTSEQRYIEVGSIIAQAVADGMDIKTAKAYADAIAFYTNDALLSARIGRDIQTGKFKSGSEAALRVASERINLAATKLPELVAAPDAAQSVVSEALGTTGAVNMWGESVLSLAPPLSMAYQATLNLNDAVSDGIDFWNDLGYVVSQTPQDFLKSSVLNANNNLKEMELNVENAATTIGSTIQTLKELENVEALLNEEYKNGKINADQYRDRLKELNDMQTQQAELMGQAIKISTGADTTKQAISDQLILAGMSKDMADTVANQTNKNAVAQKLFGKKFDDLGPGSAEQEVVTDVIAETLTGITEENASQRIADIENVYAKIAEQLVKAAEEGLSAAEIDSVVVEQEMRNFVNSVFGDVQAPIGQKGQAAENLANVDTQGLSRETITSGLAGFVDSRAALDIASSEQKLNNFISLLKGLEQYPAIDLEILMKTQGGRDPEDVISDVEKTLKEMSKLKFKGVSQEVKNALPPMQEFLNASLDAGKSFADIPGLYKDVAQDAQKIVDEVGVKKDGSLKPITQEAIVSIYGDEVDNPSGLASTINGLFPDNLSPIFLPIAMQLLNPELLSAMGNPEFAAKYAKAKESGEDTVTVGGGGYYTGTRATTVSIDPLVQVEALNSSFMGNTTKGPTGSGAGGGGGQKSILEQLQDQFNQLKEIYNGVDRFIKSKTGQFKKVMAGPFGPEFIEFLKSQGEEGIKILNGKMGELKKVYNEYVKVQFQNAKNFAQTFPGNVVRQTQQMAAERTFRGRLSGQGIEGEVADQLVSGLGPEVIRTYERAKKLLQDPDVSFKDLSKKQQESVKIVGEALRNATENSKEFNAELSRTEATSNIQDLRNESETLNKLLGMGYTREQAEELMSIGISADLSAGEIRDLADEYFRLKDSMMTVEEAQKALAETQQQLLGVEDNIASLKAQIAIEENLRDDMDDLEALEKSNEAISRRIELEQRKLEPIDEAIKKLEEEKEKINEAYDAQFKALDEVARKEDQLARVRQGRLDVASALSRGDVAGAAQAAIAMQQEMAQQRQEETRAGLEAARQREIDAIQEDINAKMDERKAIEDAIKALQIEQRGIQDDIYNKQKFINDETERLEGLYEVGKNELALLKGELTAAANEQKRLADEAQRYKNIIAGGGGGNTSSTPPTSTGSLPEQYNIIPDNFIYSPTPLFGKYGGKIGKYLTGGRVGFKGSREPAPGMMYGGRMKKYATGSFVPGIGMTDRVPAMLTPGEFVVRKSVAQQYGGLLSGLNSQIFPGLSGAAGSARFNVPGESRYSTRKGSDTPSIALATDNSSKNYFVTVNTSSTSDANEIANTVINKIKRSEARNVKGVKL